MSTSLRSWPVRLRRLGLNIIALGGPAVLVAGLLWWTGALSSTVPATIAVAVGVIVTGAAGVLVGLGLGFPRQKPIPVGARDEVAFVFGSKIRFRRTPGAGPVVLLVHGNNLSIDDWNPMVEALPGRNIVALDLIGYAGSDRPADLDYDIECQRRYIVGFMDEVGIDRAVVVGHSMGGTVVGWLAANSPERVVASVLIGPPGVPGCLVYAWPKGLLCRRGWLNRFAFRVAVSGLFRRLFPLTLARQGLGVTGSYDDRYLESLDRVTQPMLLIWSSGDTRCLIEYADEYRARVGDLELEVVAPDLGHMVPMADPEGTARLIGRFLDRLGDAGPPKAADREASPATADSPPRSGERRGRLDSGPGAF